MLSMKTRQIATHPSHLQIDIQQPEVNSLGLSGRKGLVHYHWRRWWHPMSMRRWLSYFGTGRGVADSRQSRLLGQLLQYFFYIGVLVVFFLCTPYVSFVLVIWTGAVFFSCAPIFWRKPSQHIANDSHLPRWKVALDGRQVCLQECVVFTCKMRSSHTHFQRQVFEVQRLWHRCLYGFLPRAESGMGPKRCQRFHIPLLSASLPQKEHVLWRRWRWRWRWRWWWRWRWRWLWRWRWRWWWWWSRPTTSYRTAHVSVMWHLAMLLPHFSSIVNRWLSTIDSQAGRGDATDLESEARRARQRGLKTKSCRGSGVSATGLLSVRDLECSAKKVQGCSRSFAPDEKWKSAE